jgi:hypothetical protein
LQDSSETNGHNLNNDVKTVELSGEKREYLKNKINELETNSKSKNMDDVRINYVTY